MKKKNAKLTSTLDGNIKFSHQARQKVQRQNTHSDKYEYITFLVA